MYIKLGNWFISLANYSLASCCCQSFKLLVNVYVSIFYCLQISVKLACSTQLFPFFLMHFASWSVSTDLIFLSADNASVQIIWQNFLRRLKIEPADNTQQNTVTCQVCCTDFQKR